MLLITETFLIRAAVATLITVIVYSVFFGIA